LPSFARRGGAIVCGKLKIMVFDPKTEREKNCSLNKSISLLEKENFRISKSGFGLIFDIDKKRDICYSYKNLKGKS